MFDKPWEGWSVAKEGQTKEIQVWNLSFTFDNISTFNLLSLWPSSSFILIVPKYVQIVELKSKRSYK